MPYNNVKVKARQIVAQTTTQRKDLGTVTNVPMGEWNSSALYKKLNIVRYNGASYMATRENSNIAPSSNSNIWQLINKDGNGIKSALISYQAGVSGTNSPTGEWSTDVPEVPQGQYLWTRVVFDFTDGSQTTFYSVSLQGLNFTQQDRDDIDRIIEVVPSSATADNQLADKAFVNSSINNLAAFYITYNANGDAFPTRATLLNATTFYSGGQQRTPTQNDYAIVLADESQPKGVDGTYPTTRYSYQGGTYPNGQWDFQYVVNNTSLTQAQVDAINSGITASKLTSIDTALNNKANLSGANFTGAVSAPSGLITGDLVVKGDQYTIGNLTGINGTNGYVKIARITIHGYYSNTPLCIEISARNSLLSKKIFIQYNSENNDTPALYFFSSIGSTDLKAYISQDTNNKSVWYLIVKKVEAFDNIQVLDFRHAPFGDIRVEWTNEHLNSLPESYTECGSWEVKKSGDTMTGPLTVPTLNTDTINGATKGNAILRQDPSSGRVVIGSYAQPLRLVGNTTRPKYDKSNGSISSDIGTEMALLTDVPTQAYQVDAVPLFSMGNTGNSVRYYMFARTSSSNPDGDTGATLLISGLGNYGGKYYGAWLVEITNRGSVPSMIVTQITAPDDGTVTFGYRTNGSYFEFGVYTSTYRADAKIAVLKNTNTEIGTYYNSSTIPTGWTVATAINKVAMEADITSSVYSYGVCSTAAGTTAKTVNLSGFSLVTGARITVKFTTANTVSSPTLNVNGTGAKAMKCKNRTTGLAWQAEIMSLVYDGTNWCIVDGYSLMDKPVGAYCVQYYGESEPAALFGGTWTIDLDYEGRTIIGAGPGTATGVTGGEASHKLTVQELPPHAHEEVIGFKDTITYELVSPYGTGDTVSGAYFNSNIAQLGFRDKIVLTTTTGNGYYHNNMPPYKAVNIWKRTA